MELNESEKRILNALMLNSRQSYKDLAKQAKVSIVTISNKMKKFKDLKIINGFNTLINHSALGYDFHVFIQIKVSRGKESEIEKKLDSSPRISFIYDTTGEFDILIIGRFKSRSDLDKYVKLIQTYDFVERVQTSLILNTIKEKPILLD